MKFVKMDKPVVSMIIPSRDEGQNLKKTIESIRKNTEYPNYEIIVVDDGTGSDSELVKDMVVKIIKTPTVGVAQARNAGAKKADGDIFVFLDAHVFPRTSNWLDEMVRLLHNRKIGICSPCIAQHGKEGSKGYGMTLKNYFLDVEWLSKRFDDPYEVPFVGGACFGIRKDTFYRIGGWNQYSKVFGINDIELCFKAWMYGYHVYVIPKAEVSHIFRSKHPYSVSWDHVGWNMMVFGHLHFNGDRLSKLVREMKKRLGKKKTKELLTELGEEIHLKRKEHFQNRLYDDDWFFERFGLEF